MERTGRKSVFAWLLAAVVLFGSLAFAGEPCYAAGADTGNYFKGVWISTIYHLDYPDEYTADAEKLKSQADAILDYVNSIGLDAIFLQVRCSSDAFYASSIFPWSKYLTGTQGIAPENGFDPLEYWVEGAHKRGLELHAWVNPYRITKGKDTEFATLTADNPAKQHPEWVIKSTDGNYYYNPGLSEVRNLVVKGALEIVKNYDVDGVHMDDYFYPAEDFPDEATFAKYGSGYSDIGDWRRENVNLLIRQLDESLHAVDPDLEFGISPSGIWANRSHMQGGSATTGNESYFSSYADTKKWVENGWIDYIIPQVYWSIGYSVADYRILANWWNETVKGTDVKLYMGMADYRSVDAKETSDFYGTAEIQRQMTLNRTLSNVSGEVHFRYQSLKRVTGSAVAQQSRKDASQAQSGGVVVSTEKNARFGDLGSCAWAEEYIYKLADRGIVGGTSPGCFRPMANVKRSEYIKMLMNAFDYDSNAYKGSKNVFSDVAADHWSVPFVACAKDNGILIDIDTFRPEENITREDMALYAYRAIVGTGTELQVKNQSIEFTDKKRISDEAKKAVTELVKAGVLNGYADGSFGPGKTCTRAEASKVVCILLDAYDRSH